MGKLRHVKLELPWTALDSDDTTQEGGELDCHQEQHEGEHDLRCIIHKHGHTVTWNVPFVQSANHKAISV